MLRRIMLTSFGQGAAASRADGRREVFVRERIRSSQAFQEGVELHRSIMSDISNNVPVEINRVERAIEIFGRAHFAPGVGGDKGPLRSYLIELDNLRVGINKKKLRP